MTRRFGKAISASELAQASVCEQQLVFDATHGKKHSGEREAKIRAGLAAHDTLHTDAMLAYSNVETSREDRRCFIATVAFGPDAPETDALRMFRDRALLPHQVGRALVSFYYLLSPPVARFLEQHPSLLPPVRSGLAMACRLIKAGVRA